jgi:hypothetical protein
MAGRRACARRYPSSGNGTERNGDTHRPCRVGLPACDARHDRERGGTRCQMQKSTAGKFHRDTPRACVAFERRRPQNNVIDFPIARPPTAKSLPLKFTKRRHVPMATLRLGDDNCMGACRGDVAYCPFSDLGRCPTYVRKVGQSGQCFGRSTTRDFMITGPHSSCIRAHRFTRLRRRPPSGF